jgi:hypothetical protein
MFSNTFFILGLAGLEFALGFLILIVFKKFNLSINIIDNSNLDSVINKESNKNFNLINFF